MMTTGLRGRFYGHCSSLPPPPSLLLPLSPSTRGNVEEARSLATTVLIVAAEDPAKRTMISLEKQEALTVTEEENNSKVPKFFNRFEFILFMSSGFDLLGMFESKRKTVAVFTLKCSAAAIMAKIAAAVWGLRFCVAKVKDFKIQLQGAAEGRKGRLTVMAEVFKVAPEVTFATKTMEGEGSCYNRVTTYCLFRTKAYGVKVKR
ncbi:CBL-interacting serine/threonine-protein kinase 5 [Glycine soja]